MADDKRDYEVGYGKPPKASRFKPGQSGNPRGRPRGQANLLTDLVKELAEQILVREGERVRTVSKQRAMLKALVAKSLKGDARTAALVINMLVKLSDEAAPDLPVQAATASADQAVIDAYLKRALADAGLKDHADD